MKVRQVYYGRTRIIQTYCEKCETWGFTDKHFCSSCGVPYDIGSAEECHPEYRLPITDWRSRVKDKIRRSVYERDDYVCQYCARRCYDSWITDPRQLTLDHAISWTTGGGNVEENLLTCCRECNIIKGNKIFSSIEQAREYIRSKE